ncbi:MAG: GNAT family N-acetyltransferase [Rhodoferax sp.]|nr:GNAT family N-acetyltransferase [Rhodoferax sp.]
MNLNQITLPALDVAASIAFYKRLGCTLLVESAHYARFKAPKGDVTLSVHMVDQVPTVSQVVVYFECGALDLRVAELKALGVQFTQEPADERWLWREARLLDPSGNPICLYLAGSNRLNPPWRVGGQQAAGLVTPTLETPRLLLRPLLHSDLPEFLEINRDEEVTRYLPYAAWVAMIDAVAWYHRMLGLIADGKIAYNAVVEKASGRVIGGTLLRDIDGDTGKLEVGYVLGRAFWGRGLMREAVGAVVDYAFATPEMRRVEAHIDGRNTASQRLVESLGFKCEAVLRDHWLDKGEVSDATVYGVLRREWDAGKASI